MPFEVKIMLFSFGVSFSIWYIKRNPETLVSKILMSWNGPIPKEGESQSRFTLRWSIYSFKWCMEIFVIWGFLFWMFEGKLYAGESMFVTATLGFALPLGFFIAVIACIGFVVKSAWFSMVRKNYKFSEQSGKFDKIAST